jgi:hypothetical protein
MTKKSFIITHKKHVFELLILTILLVLVKYVWILFMPGITIYINSKIKSKYLPVLNTQDCYTCSFTEFLPFNSEMYYFSSFKAFEI